jgi:predicted GH43/DUF377 family glycosyl hydrolase
MLTLGLLIAITLGLGAEPVQSPAEILDWAPSPFVKYEGNPIMEPQGDGFEAMAVFNPTVIVEDGIFYMLYRAEDRKGVSRIGLAESADGINFVRRSEPVLSPTERYEIWGGCEDPRVVKIEDTYYLTYTAYNGWRAKLALATSTDLVHWEKHGVIIPWPWSKAGAIVPQRINGEYVMYFGDSSIWIAYSDDLINWDVVNEPVMKTRPGHFDSRGIEPGPIPIMTEQGILLIYNGWNDNITYKVGAVLFSKDDPTRVLKRFDQPILEPTEVSELQGQVPNVVFASGLVQHEDVWYLYYGGADNCIGLAIADSLWYK